MGTGPHRAEKYPRTVLNAAEKREPGELFMPIRVLKLKIRFVVERDDGNFHAFVPDLKGLHVDGSTQAEALENAKRAVELYLHSLMKHEEPIPVGVLEDDLMLSASQLFRHFLRSIKLRQRQHSFIEEITLQAA
jgi:predicted RNase H-like HicB family nuclease